MGQHPVLKQPEQFAGSAVFYKTFDEAMGLVEETAVYLDGHGKLDSQELVGEPAVAYAALSMRLATRLMLVSSWLLAQRAVFKGQLDHRTVPDAKYRLTDEGEDPGRHNHVMDQLPPRLLGLIEHSNSLYQRVGRIDQSMYISKTVRTVGKPPFADQIQRIEKAFRQPA